MAWDDPSHSLLGFLMICSREGARGLRRLIHSYVHLESLRRSMSMRLEALEEGSLGASIHGGAMGARDPII
jgi:hypothetical protein